jgi:hypothetical protein
LMRFWATTCAATVHERCAVWPTGSSNGGPAARKSPRSSAAQLKPLEATVAVYYPVADES